MGVRLHFIVEGQTEEAFVNQILKPHLANKSVWADATLSSTRSTRRHVIADLIRNPEGQGPG